MDWITLLIGIVLGTFVGFFLYAYQAYRIFPPTDGSGLLFEYWKVIRFILLGDT